MAKKTNAEILDELREAAWNSARLVKILAKPVLDPRDFDGGEVPDKPDLHRMTQLALGTLGTWAKTVEPDQNWIAMLMKQRTEVVAFMKTRPPELIMAMRAAGLELREVAAGESREQRVLALRQALAEPDEELKEALTVEGWER